MAHSRRSAASLQVGQPFKESEQLLQGNVRRKRERGRELELKRDEQKRKKERTRLRQDPPPPLEAILVIFGCRALIFFLFESSRKK